MIDNLFTGKYVKILLCGNQFPPMGPGKITCHSIFKGNIFPYNSTFYSITKVAKYL